MDKINIYLIIIAYFLDLFIGDPQDFYHPVRMIGDLINYFEKLLYNSKDKKVAGAILAGLVVIIILIASYSLLSLSIILHLFLMYSIFAVKSLGDEGLRLYKLLKNDKIEEAKLALSYVVSRDTKNMGQNDIIRSAIETVAENITDAVTGPIFYLVFFGLPGAMVYKAVSTMDSMIGYKNKKYRHFGRAAARFDDFLNIIPARVTGFILIPVASLFLRNDAFSSLKSVIKYRRNHDSPNSAYSEAAVAGALNIQLGGRNVYFGKVSHKPLIGNKNKSFEVEDIRKTVAIMYVVSFLALGFFLSLKVLIWSFILL